MAILYYISLRKEVYKNISISLGFSPFFLILYLGQIKGLWLLLNGIMKQKHVMRQRVSIKLKRNDNYGLLVDGKMVIKKYLNTYKYTHCSYGKKSIQVVVTCR